MERARGRLEYVPVADPEGGAPAESRIWRDLNGRTPVEPPREVRIVYREPVLLRLMAGFVYFCFGFLKFFPDLSPAELLASEAIMRISDHRLDAATSLRLLAFLEVAIGLSLIFKFQLRWMFYAFLFHQVCTFLPLFILPELTFKIAPFAPTMEGQYILKNVISLAAGLTIMLPAIRQETQRKADRRALQGAQASAPVFQLQR